MKDSRPDFVDVKTEFQKFLQTEGWPTEILWLAGNRIVGYRRNHWVFRPNQLSAEHASRNFYETIRRTQTSIRIDALARIEGRTLAYVQDWGGDRRMLNYGVPLSEWPVKAVSSRVVWECLRLLTWALGRSPFLNSTSMPTTAEHPAGTRPLKSTQAQRQPVSQKRSYAR